MEIALVTDELSADPQTALELAVEWGIRHVELRGYFTDRVPQLSAYQYQRLKRLVADSGVTVTAISPGLFKIPFPAAAPATSNLGWMDRGMHDRWADAQAQLRHHLETLLPASIAFAQDFGARFIVAFSFHRAGQPGGPPPAGVAETLAQAAERVRAAGLTLLIETEEGFWADTGARSARLVDQVGDPGLAINWDPANSFCEGDVPFPDGYAAVRRHVRNVHFKDARRLPGGGGEFVALGEVDWKGQIKALVADGYSGGITLEPHLEPMVPAVRQALERLRGLIAAAEQAPVRIKRGG
jgi:sugar phosphate isomerase/epimerase